MTMCGILLFLGSWATPECHLYRRTLASPLADLKNAYFMVQIHKVDSNISVS